MMSMTFSVAILLGATAIDAEPKSEFVGGWNCRQGLTDQDTVLQLSIVPGEEGLLADIQVSEIESLPTGSAHSPDMETQTAETMATTLSQLDQDWPQRLFHMHTEEGLISIRVSRDDDNPFWSDQVAWNGAPGLMINVWQYFNDGSASRSLASFIVCEATQ